MSQTQAISKLQTKIENHKELNICVLAGGFSPEREVSLRSANNVLTLLEANGFNNLNLIDIKTTAELNLVAEEADKTDLFILMTHGKYGEDGCLQGLLEFNQAKYTGSKVLASAMCMDKVVCKKILKAEGLPVLDNLKLNFQKSIASLKDRIDLIKFPIIVKARAEGSSIGIAAFNTKEELIEKLEQDEQYREQLKTGFFVEPFIKGKEVTTSIAPYHKKLYQELKIDQTALSDNPDVKIRDKLISLPILGLSTDNQFYDFEAKYTPGATKFELPAELKPELSEKIHNLALDAYKSLNCAGFARVDFIIDEQTQEPYILEINTLPGMTETSDLPAQVAAAKLDIVKMLQVLIYDTLECQ
jgi:D-alanine-D-alanine ligase